jgi:hypothetical protein
MATREAEVRKSLECVQVKKLITILLLRSDFFLSVRIYSTGFTLFQSNVQTTMFDEPDRQYNYANI